MKIIYHIEVQMPFVFREAEEEAERIRAQEAAEEEERWRLRQR